MLFFIHNKEFIIVQRTILNELNYIPLTFKNIISNMLSWIGKKLLKYKIINKIPLFNKKWVSHNFMILDYVLNCNRKWMKRDEKEGKIIPLFGFFFYKYWYYWSWAQVVSNSRNSLFGMKNRNETSKEELSWFILFPFHCTWWNKASKMTIYIHKKMTILSLIFFLS